jgi:hypothetical protein
MDSGPAANAASRKVEQKKDTPLHNAKSPVGMLANDRNAY